MKRNIIMAAMIAAIIMPVLVYGQAENYRFLKIDLSLGAAVPTGEGNKGGFLYAVEPKLNFQDNLSVGLKAEFAGMARGTMVNDRQFRGDVAYNFVLQPTAEYFLLSGVPVRPFVGVGAGFYNIAEAKNVVIDENDPNSNPNPDDFNKKTLFGVMARAGVEVWHLRAAIEYNMMPNTGSVANNYLGLKVGLFIGGGRKGL